MKYNLEKFTVAGYRSGLSSKDKFEPYFTAQSGVIKVGDRIVRLNGEDISGWAAGKLASALQAATVPYTITVQPVDGSDRHASDCYI